MQAVDRRRATDAMGSEEAGGRAAAGALPSGCLGRHARPGAAGFLLLSALLFVAGIATLMTVGLSRSMGEMLAANRGAAGYQAFHLAEAGIDEAIAELVLGGGDFLEAEDWVDQNESDDNERCDAGEACRKALSLDPGPGQFAEATVSVDDVSAVEPTITAEAATGSPDARIVRTVEVMLRRVALMEHAWLALGDVEFRSGQQMTLNGGSGKVHVQGNLTMEGGSGNNKDIILKARQITITGALRRTINDNRANEADTYIENTATGQRKEVPKPASPSDPPWESTANPADFYNNWLTPSPDFRGFLTERNTGARSLSGLPSPLTDIDAFVRFVRDQAHVTINDTSELPYLGCPGAFATKSFANASTLQMASVVEIDLSVFNGCLGSPTILYSKVPVRLVNGNDLQNDFTVASPQAVYIKGNFNTISQKATAVVSGNRVYSLSARFKDYEGFISPGASTLAEAIRTGFDANGDGNSDKPDYDKFVALYGNPAAQQTTLPVYAAWLPTYAEPTEQRVAVVSPLLATNDHGLTGIDHTIEDWGETLGYNNKAEPGNDGYWVKDKKVLLKQVGSFVNLPDPEPATLDPQQVAAGTPQDHRAMRWEEWEFVTHGPRREFVYDESLRTKAPAGLGAGTQVIQRFWKERLQ